MVITKATRNLVENESVGLKPLQPLQNKTILSIFLNNFGLLTTDFFGIAFLKSTTNFLIKIYFQLF